MNKPPGEDKPSEIDKLFRKFILFCIILMMYMFLVYQVTENKYWQWVIHGVTLITVVWVWLHRVRNKKNKHAHKKNKPPIGQ